MQSRVESCAGRDFGDCGGAGGWDWLSGTIGAVSPLVRSRQSAYPQPQTGQPTVEQVGPPPDVVPAGTPGSPATPPPIKGR
jgi:hypothetical protein